MRLGSLHTIHTKSGLFYEEYVSFLDFMDFYWNHLNEINFSKNKNQNSFRCMCQSEYVCLKTDDDLSVSAYVYRCRQLKKDGDTNSS